MRLALLSATATALVVAAAFTLLSVRTNATTRRLVAGQAGQGQRTLLALQRRGNVQFVAAATLVAASPSLRSAIGTARLERNGAAASPHDLARTVQRELEQMAPDLERDLVAATDERGRIVAAHVAGTAGAAGPRLASGADMSSLPAVHNALDPSRDGGGASLYLSVLRIGDAYYHVATAPIVLDGFTIGTAMLGDRLDQRHLARMQQAFGGELVITERDAFVAGTLPALRTVRPAADGEAMQPRPVTVNGVEYMLASMPFGTTQDGAPVALSLLHAVTPALEAARRALLRDFMLWGLLAVAVAGFGSAMLARTVLEPLEAFVAQLRASVGNAGMQHGLTDPGGRRRYGRRPTVEIRWLHVSFARLMASLARQREQLEARGADLAAANAVLTAEVQERTLAEHALRESEVRLAHQAFHDPLTGLANRTRFRAEVERAVAARPSMPGSVVVLFLDLDHFKNVNDSLGHAVGDQLLVEVARRLVQVTGPGITVARLGGDEFAVLLETVSGDDDLLAMLNRIFRVLRAPVALERAEVLVGVSIGVARAAPGDGADELVRNADVAMYRAKQHGRGGHAMFEPAMHAAVLERLELESDLRRALANPDANFRLVYQPIVALEYERIVGVEALCRWEHPTRGLITPDRFIPLAEATGLVIPLGRWVLATACRQAAEWQRVDRAAAGAGGMDAPYVAVNLSGRQLEDDALVADVGALLAETGLDPARLLLEITESVLVQRADASLRTLHALKSLGVRLAIDDFGTGYSSLAYLQRFPVDVLKIDKAFIDGVAEGAAEVALARGIVSLASSLGLRCVAEGIERTEQARQLRSIGCGYGQGFLFARPLTTAQATSLLAGRAQHAVLESFRGEAVAS